MLNQLIKVTAKYFLVVLVLLLGSSYLKAQNGGGLTSQEALISRLLPATGLNIGERVPDVTFQMVNYKSPTARLSDFKGKLVILDFWATWCASCIQNFPKMRALQDKFKDKLQVVLVNSKDTRDDEIKIKTLFDRLRTTQDHELLPSVILDSDLEKLFPHKLLPHYVWIDASGKVRAITSSYEVSEENIQAIIDNENVILTEKIDIDKNKPLYSGASLPLNSMLQYSIFLKGNLSGLPTSGKVTKSGNVVCGSGIFNAPLIQMYKTILRSLKPEFPSYGVVVEVNDSSKLFADKSTDKKEKWEHENVYTYELIVPVTQAGKLYSYMLADINKYSDYEGAFEKRKVSCLALVRTSKDNKVKTQGGEIASNLYGSGEKYLKNAPIRHLIARLNDIGDNNLFVVDKTGLTENIDIRFDVDFSNLNAVRKELKRYDLDLLPTKSEMEVFVISDDNKSRKETPVSTASR